MKRYIDGPVLSARNLRALHVKLEVNPILCPPQARADGPYLQWNMLFKDNYIHLSSDDDPRASWGNRDEPATIPRTDFLIIVSPFFPWTHTINNRGRAITTGKLLSELSKFLNTFTTSEEYDHAPEHLQREVYGAWELNRSRGQDVPGGALARQMLKLDFLVNNTMFEGITTDEHFVAERLGFSARKAGGRGERERPDRVDPCALVLLLGPRPGMQVPTVGGAQGHGPGASPRRSPGRRPASRQG
jgi:hypothetical protein